MQIEKYFVLTNVFLLIVIIANQGIDYNIKFMYQSFHFLNFSFSFLI